MSAIAERYQRFAREEAAGRSRAYETLAKCVAESSVTLAFLARLPTERQQPNLLFAALRRVAGTPSSVEALDHAIEAYGKAVAEVMQTHTTQTNEPGRCAALLPVLAQIEGPLALIEVGASAGLCLLPDKPRPHSRLYDSRAYREPSKTKRTLLEHPGVLSAHRGREASRRNAGLLGGPAACLLHRLLSCS